MARRGNELGYAIGTVIGGLIGAGARGRGNARQYNTYMQNTNQSLGPGYQLDYTPRKFMWKDPSKMYGGIDEAAKRMYDRQGVGTAMQLFPGMGINPNMRYDLVKDYATGAIIPQRKMLLEADANNMIQQSAIQNLGPAMRYTNAQMGIPGATQQIAPPQSGPGGALKGGASYIGELPPIPDMTGLTVKDLMGYRDTEADNQRADRSENREEKRYGLDVRKQDQAELEYREAAPRRAADLERVKAETAKASKELKLMLRRSPTRIEILNHLNRTRRNGKQLLSDKDYIDAIKNSSPMDAVWAKMAAEMEDTEGGGNTPTRGERNDPNVGAPKDVQSEVERFRKENGY